MSPAGRQRKRSGIFQSRIISHECSRVGRRIVFPCVYRMTVQVPLKIERVGSRWRESQCSGPVILRRHLTPLRFRSQRLFSLLRPSTQHQPTPIYSPSIPSHLSPIPFFNSLGITGIPATRLSSALPVEGLVESSPSPHPLSQPSSGTAHSISILSRLSRCRWSKDILLRERSLIPPLVESTSAGFRGLESHHPGIVKVPNSSGLFFAYWMPSHPFYLPCF